MSAPRSPIYHLRRALRQQPQERRRAQREAAAVQLAALDEFAAQLAARHRAFVLGITQQSTQAAQTDPESPADTPDPLPEQLH